MNNGELVCHVYELFSSGKLDAIRELIADDFEWTFFGPTELPWAGTYVGHAGFDRFFAAVAEHVEVEDFTVQEYVEADDRVVAVGTSTARVEGSEVRYHTNWINVFTVTGGRITRLLDLYETASVVEALRLARSSGAA